jgi:predicted transcriptional regulator
MVFFESVYYGLDKINKGQTLTTHSLKPAVPIEESIKDKTIICLEDGKEFKMLKRHLATNYNLTPDQYRQKWHLPANYPMVAPEYSKTRKELAKKSGLGTNR